MYLKHWFINNLLLQFQENPHKNKATQFIAIENHWWHQERHSANIVSMLQQYKQFSQLVRVYKIIKMQLIKCCTYKVQKKCWMYLHRWLF